jgi:protein-serine/threonine kinase
MKPKSYGTLVEGAEDGSDSATAASHKSNRSISEFQPGPLHNERPRIVTIGNITTATADPMHLDSALHREKYLAEQRGLAQPRLPTPPPSNWSMTGSEADEGYSTRDDNDFIEYLTVRQGPSKQKRRYRAVRPLGQGTFSKVMLATSEKLPTTTKLDEASESILNPRNLVAIKVVQHGPAGGADAERIDVGMWDQNIHPD